jgi:hypothetical protein
MVSIGSEGLSALITAMVVMKMCIGSMQRVEAVKCGVFICTYEAYDLSLNSKLQPNFCSVTGSQPK